MKYLIILFVFVYSWSALAFGGRIIQWGVEEVFSLTQLFSESVLYGVGWFAYLLLSGQIVLVPIKLIAAVESEMKHYREFRY
ncbi:hypothetical protein M3919_003904 [Vibrio parahaemolyticus]|uniref:hypothetical protein n=1 Tax=Vibrio parahaemolyticus TaxID=670 RepID=UPI0037528A9C|nr:hypothetical protein [Vibrio parahaemolyticus]EJE4158668.1 hypothetical protein [Vibrio parahaemolyticus]